MSWIDWILKMFKIRKKAQENLPNSEQNMDFSKTRDINTPQTRDMNGAMSAQIRCPYCSSKDTVKRGLRVKKYEPEQRYLCNDSVTVATEVPVYMDEMDIEHMQEVLGFKIPDNIGTWTGHCVL